MQLSGLGILSPRSPHSLGHTEGHTARYKPYFDLHIVLKKKNKKFSKYKNMQAVGVGFHTEELVSDN